MENVQDINPVNIYGDTPLYMARCNGHSEVVQLLKQYQKTWQNIALKSVFVVSMKNYNEIFPKAFEGVAVYCIAIEVPVW